MSEFVQKGDQIPEGDMSDEDADKTAAELAVEGAPEEVADRTADSDADERTTYRKEFLVAAPFDEDHDYADDDHTSNMASMVQDAINAGLRVIGDPVFVSAEACGPYGRQNNMRSILMTYEAEAVPAHLVGAGPTEETTDVMATMAEVISPSDVVVAGEDGSPSETAQDPENPVHQVAPDALGSDDDDESEETI